MREVKELSDIIESLKHLTSAQLQVVFDFITKLTSKNIRKKRVVRNKGL